MTFLKQFLNSGFRNGISNYQLVTLPNFAKFHSQTTEIQSCKVGRFLIKMLKFYHDDVIGDFEILFGM